MPKHFHSITKAGLLPFIRQSPLRFCVMQPVAKHPGLGPPPFQICKGTRMVKENGLWRDMEPHDDALNAETFEQTALREAEEEIGLKREAIRELTDLGEVYFTSARKGTRKSMWLFAARVENEDCLLPMEKIHPTTQARRWCDLAEFRKIGREDHASIIEQALKILA